MCNLCIVQTGYRMDSWLWPNGFLTMSSRPWPISFRFHSKIQYTQQATTTIAGKGSNCEALQLEGCTTSRQSFWAVLVHFIVRMRTHWYFPASDQTSDIAIRFSDPDFLTEINNFAIRWSFQAVTLTFHIWPWTFVVGYIGCHVIKLCTKFDRYRTICGEIIYD